MEEETNQLFLYLYLFVLIKCVNKIIVQRLDNKDSKLSLGDGRENSVNLTPLKN